MVQKIEALRDMARRQPVIPVVAVDSAASAVAMAKALVRGGLPAIEITLRTPAALDAIRAVAAEVPDALVGAGTILTPAQFGEAEAAGARFIVSPGATSALFDRADRSDVPLLPGAATPAELMLAIERGYSFLKFFPAEQLGGAAFLRALAPVFPEIRFCPTGGVSPENVADYLAIPTVACVGGSWVAPRVAVQGGDWDAVERLAREAASLRSAV